MMMKPLLTAFGMVALLAACDDPATTATAPADTGADPLSGSWRILSIGGSKVEDPNATLLTFTGLTTVTGTFGCQQFTGNYTYDRNVVFITNFSIPANTCAGAAERQQRHGTRLIGMPMTVVADQNSAILSGREGQSFALSR